MVRAGNRDRLTSEESPSIASYGMGATYASASFFGDSVEVDANGEPVADRLAAPLPLPLPLPHRVKKPRVRRGVSFSRNTKEAKAKASMKKRHNPDLPEPKNEDVGSGKYWKCFTLAATCLIPNFLICKPDQAAKQAWREKIVIFEIFLLANIVFLFFFGVIPLYFCRIEDNPLAGYEWYQTIEPTTCDIMEYASYVLIFTVAALLALQCACSLYLGIQSLLFRISSDRPWEPTDFRSPVVVMVPCYNEGDKELGKTINSILETNYPQDHKVLLVVADGIITGRGEYFSTPATLARLLGFSLDSKRDAAYAYKSLGEITENRASVYSGVHERDGKLLKYVVVVKRGTPAEKESSKPGNRGKRDSQLIALGLFNRVHHDRKCSDLDKALIEAFDSLGVQAKDIEYMLAIDADTRISIASICHMVYKMNHRTKVLACCGETKVDNKRASWVTMIQVYEYFASHHLKKSFESVFGCVTCLPGCFTMYRMTSEDGRALISSDTIFQSYARNDINSLHEKNLFHLGEDRMLTTLLLKLFPDMSLSFVPIASCWTIVPDKFKVLLSQRRRWINSTFHNMWELMKVDTMCGFCCVSMNSIVIVDTICFLILPASIIYGVAYTYTAIADEAGMSIVTIVLYAVLFGAQMIIFLARSRFDYLLWFLIYLILGVPVFYFILPVYSFWNMDDFSWGTTRQVAPGKKTTAAPSAASAKPKPPAPMKEKPRPAVMPPVAEENSRPVRQSAPATMNAAQLYARSHSWEDGYKTGSTNSSAESAAMRKQNKAHGKSMPAAMMNGGPVDLDEESVAIGRKQSNASKPSVGPIDLDDDFSQSPTKKQPPQFYSFGSSFSGDDPNFEDLYDDDYCSNKVDV